jgi:hypothetical protein
LPRIRRRAEMLQVSPTHIKPVDDRTMSFQQLFALGMMRHLPELLTCDGRSFDVGASGKYIAPGAIALGPPTWVWPRDKIPCGDDQAATVHAYHFLEHLTGSDAILFLREVERVLIPVRGVLNFSVPYFSSVLAAQDLDHKSRWCEETFQNLFEDDTYEHSGKWRLKVRFLLIAGIVNRNMCIIGQIVKTDERQREIGKWFHPNDVTRYEAVVTNE